MAQVTVVVCDTCKNVKKDVTGYTVTRDDGRKVKKVLCDTHARPLESMLSETEAPVTRGRGRRTPVTTIEEIEARKNK